MKGQRKMETIGKVLSITLLTIFGSAAATVYLVDSNIMPSFMGKNPVSYTSDTSKPQNDSRFYHVSYYRERARFKYAEPVEESDEPEHYSDVSPIWGQSYDSKPASPSSSEERARRLARENSIDSLKKNIEYWNGQYEKALKSGRSGNADTAYRNYAEYMEALGLKQSSVHK